MPQAKSIDSQECCGLSDKKDSVCTYLTIVLSLSSLSSLNVVLMFQLIEVKRIGQHF